MQPPRGISQSRMVPVLITATIKKAREIEEAYRCCKAAFKNSEPSPNTRAGLLELTTSIINQHDSYEGAKTANLIKAELEGLKKEVLNRQLDPERLARRIQTIVDSPPLDGPPDTQLGPQPEDGNVIPTMTGGFGQAAAETDRAVAATLGDSAMSETAPLTQKQSIYKDTTLDDEDSF
jgi:hypothetical protein